MLAFAFSLLSLFTSVLGWSFNEALGELGYDITHCQKSGYSPFYTVQSAFVPNITTTVVWGFLGNFSDISQGYFYRATGTENTPGVRRYYKGSVGQDEYQELIFSYGDNRKPSPTSPLFAQMWINGDACDYGQCQTGTRTLYTVVNASHGAPGVTITYAVAGCSNGTAVATGLFAETYGDLLDFLLPVFHNLTTGAH